MDNKLPHYTQVELLGEGGMGKVYLALDNKLQRKVAIKELTYLSKTSTNDDKLVRALQEARLLARVNHTNIIQIYNIHDNDDGNVSLVMEYFKSKSLDKFQKEHRLTLLQQLDLLRQLSAGLVAAHSNDVVHCDLKPSNILVNQQGQLKIADFGIACLASNNVDSEQQTKPAEYGCLFYMSPEQIKQQTIDYRSDIFSLGIIAYQLIVGSHPFACSKDNSLGLASEVADRICDHTPEHAKNLVHDLPSALTDLLMEMLVKPVEQRIITAAAIDSRLKLIQKALQQRQKDEQPTLLLSKSLQREKHHVAPVPKWRVILAKILSSICFLSFATILGFWFFSSEQVKAKQVVILKPIVVNSSLMAVMQQDLVISAVEDALRQAVINTKDMYLVSQREVNAITKGYPDDLKKLKQAVGASDIISTTLECDNNRCKVNFSRLVANPDNSEMLSVKFEENWLVPIEKFNAIYSTSQTQFASLFPKHPDINQGALVQRTINEADYKNYITLYNQIRGKGKYSKESLTKLEAILTSSPYLYAAYGLYRDTALDLYWDSKDKRYLKQLDNLLKSSPPEYRYSPYEAIDRFLLASDMGELDLAKQKIAEAQKRGADDLVVLELKAYMYFSLGQYKKASDFYSQALKLRPSSTLLNNIAFSYWRMGDLIKAENTLNRMLEIVPNNHKAQRLQANIWLLQGKLKLAITSYEMLVNSLNNSKDLTNLSLAYGLNKQYLKSLEFAHKALEQTPNHPLNLLNLADVEMILGKKQSAILHYNQVVTALIGKDDVKYLTNLAQAYAQLNQASLAIEALTKAQVIAPENGEVSYTSAIIYSLLKEQTSAIHHAKVALKNNVGAVWFNLPWFDSLCKIQQFQNLMIEYENSSRCLTLD